MLDVEEKDLLNMIESIGKDQSFRLIIKKYKESIYWHIRKIVIDHDDANDVAQNTFIKAWKGLDDFRGDSKLYTWLYKIATNESITFLNSKKRSLNLSIQDANKELIDKLASDVYFNGDEIQIRLQKAILQLPDKQRIVFNMKYFDEMKYSDMAQILNTSEGALKASYHHAVKKIEEFLSTK